jgi:hypothetical protein
VKCQLWHGRGEVRGAQAETHDSWTLRSHQECRLAARLRLSAHTAHATTTHQSNKPKGLETQAGSSRLSPPTLNTGTQTQQYEPSSSKSKTRYPRPSSRTKQLLHNVYTTSPRHLHSMFQIYLQLFSFHSQPQWMACP